MKRRDFLKSLGMLGSAVLAPSLLGQRGFILPASAGVSSRRLIDARAAVLDNVGFAQPAQLPQIITIFLYGGPSELGANLTNIDEINFHSQNSYPNNLLGDNKGDVTENQLWASAGGTQMEAMIGRKQMSIVRTLNRVLDDSRAHRPSIFSNLTGLVGKEDDRAGIATNLAAVLDANKAIPADALFPFVSFDGDSVIFNRGDVSVSPRLRPMSLKVNNNTLENPYTRSSNRDIKLSDADIENLANRTADLNTARYNSIIQAFAKRGEIAQEVEKLKTDLVSSFDDPFDPGTTVEYPSNGIGRLLKAAVNLVIDNSSTLFVSLGSGGLGGWDDHNSAISDYPPRMNNLMTALDVASKHLYSAGKENVTILVFGDFGRNVNLNGSLGWDHGNNQNLYIVSGGQRLGSIIGETKVISEGNRYYTTPAANSYQSEPFAVAATIYKYFGIQNPEILTGGVAPIDENA